MSFDDDLSSVMGPLLASLSAFWLSVSEKVSSLNRKNTHGKMRSQSVKCDREHLGTHGF